MKVCFLDNNKIPYTSNDIDSNQLRGAENILINLSFELNKLGHEITIYNNCKQNIKINNIHWVNLNNINDDPQYDIAISNNDLRLFSKIKASKHIAFSHSIQSIEKFIRKGQLLSYLKYKPKIVMLSNYHSKNRNKILKLFGSINLEWAVDEIFNSTIINDNIVENRAIFTSRRDRNLDILIDIWKNFIFTKNKSLKLFVTPSNLIDNKYNIFKRSFGPKILLIKDLLKSKVFLVPGHKGELFCLAAEEARELCVPIVTLGIGSLSERVIHGKTGFIAKNNHEFAQYTLDIFNNDELWLKLRKNLMNLRGSKKWSLVALNLLKQI